MSYAEMLMGMFPGLQPEVDDLFLLEANQIALLPERAPAPQLAAVLHVHPRIRRFLTTRYPPIENYLEQLQSDHGPVSDKDLEATEQALLWEIADWIVYQRDPDGYDTRAQIDWDLAAVTEVVALDGKVVVDAGAGTGRVAFAAATAARHVFAVEPVATLRQYMRKKALRVGIGNLYVLDGLLEAIPLPPASVDVLLTCQAVGWNLTEELAEIDRVVRPRGTAMHLFGAATASQPDNPLHERLVAGGYQAKLYEKDRIRILGYWKTIAS